MNYSIFYYGLGYSIRCRKGVWQVVSERRIINRFASLHEAEQAVSDYQQAVINGLRNKL